MVRVDTSAAVTETRLRFQLGLDFGPHGGVFPRKEVEQRLASPLAPLLDRCHGNSF
jgi:hypothetical protein